jgi:histidinol-phosphate aminotransferase
MQTNRRKWLQQIGIVTAGLGIAQFKTFASPTTNLLIFAPPDDSPLRLSSNENPYGPSPLARTAMTDSITNSNRYNWDTTGKLISALAKKNNVTDDNILIGAGSTEILDLVVQYFAFQKGSFIVASPSYTSWAKTAEKLGLKKISVLLTKDKLHDLTAMLAAITTDTKLIYVCNPNNPTGTICENTALISFIQEATKKVTVMVDEAYLDFIDQPSVSNLVTDNKNLIVVKTFSKIYGLAGARMGYAIAHKDTINHFGDDLQTWANGSVGVVSRAGALASLADNDFVKQCYAKNEAASKFTIEQLTQLNITCIPSHTNFIYFSLTNYKQDYFALLKSNNIQGTYIYEEDGKWTRITVGTMDEMQKFITAIK